MMFHLTVQEVSERLRASRADMEVSDGKCVGTGSVCSGWKMLRPIGGHNLVKMSNSNLNPIPSMYAIFTYIYHTNQLNVGRYSHICHGSFSSGCIGTPSSRVTWSVSYMFLQPKWSQRFTYNHIIYIYVFIYLHTIYLYNIYIYKCNFVNIYMSIFLHTYIFGDFNFHLTQSV